MIPIFIDTKKLYLKHRQPLLISFSTGRSNTAPLEKDKWNFKDKNNHFNEKGMLKIFLFTH